MISPQLARLDEHLQRLRLNTVPERLEALLQEASAQELSYADFLDRLLSEEVTAKTAQHLPDADEPGPVPVPQAPRPDCFEHAETWYADRDVQRLWQLFWKRHR